MMELRHRFFEGGEMPSFCVVGGHVVSFEVDFRQWLQYEHAGTLGLSREDLVSHRAKLVIASAPKKSGPDDMEKAMAWFYSRGDIERLAHLDIPPNIIERRAEKPQTVNLFWDSGQLFDSFLLQYDINLYTCGKLHWWEFCSRLAGLRQDSPFMALRGLREAKEDDYRDSNGKKSRQAARAWAQIQIDKLFAGLPGGQSAAGSGEYDLEHWDDG